MTFWICERCGQSNEGAFCRNPRCGGEPISRTTQAIARPVAPLESIDRKCMRFDGVPKQVFASFDEAQEQCFTTSTRVKRLAVYFCDDHQGWHVGGRRIAA